MASPVIINNSRERGLPFCSRVRQNAGKASPRSGERGYVPSILWRVSHMGAVTARTKVPRTAHGFQGPDDLANVILAARRRTPEEGSHCGDITPAGLRQLIRSAYY